MVRMTFLNAKPATPTCTRVIKLKPTGSEWPTVARLNVEAW